MVDAVLAGELSLEGCHLTPGQDPADAGAYRGLIGEAAAALIGANQDLELSWRDLEDHDARVRVKEHQCGELAKSLQEDARIGENHAQHMVNLRYDHLANRMASIALQESGGVFGIIFSFGATLASAGPKIMLDSMVASIEAAMANAETQHQQLMQNREGDRRVAACTSEVDLMAVGRKTALAHVHRRAIETRAALVAVQNKARLPHRALAGAQAAIQRQATLPPALAATFRTWMDEDMQAYQRKFAWARQATTHAVEALEYEMQESLVARNELIAARTPAELSAVLDLMGANRLPRTVWSRRPEHHKRIVSLRQEALGLADETDAWPGGRTAEERLSAHLTSPAAAVYDDRGHYLGQGIRFVLSPAAGRQCAEKVWSVHARIEGHFSNEVPYFAEALLLKDRVFASQWCRPVDGAPPMQLAAAARFGPVHTHDDFLDRPRRLYYSSTSAHLQPRRDIEVPVFANEAYLEGSSEALAGQGLFGAYTFVFRADNRVPLDKLTDVQLRFDYHFIDRAGL